MRAQNVSLSIGGRLSTTTCVTPSSCSSSFFNLCASRFEDSLLRTISCAKVSIFSGKIRSVPTCIDAMRSTSCRRPFFGSGGTSEGVEGGAVDTYSARLGVAGAFGDGCVGGRGASADELEAAERRGFAAASRRRAAHGSPTSRESTPTGRQLDPPFCKKGGCQGYIFVLIQDT